MFKPFAAFAISAVLFAVPAASALSPADLQRCQAMGATLKPKAAEIERVKVKRDDLADTIETANEAWENAETMRNISPEEAAAADKLLLEAETSETELANLERGLQALVVQYNKDIYAYNKSCATKD